MIFKKVYLFLLSVFVLLCVSCKQNLNFDSQTEDSNNCSVKICVENFSDARTIAPEVLDFSSMSDSEKEEKYKFVLEYVSGRKTVSEEFSFSEFSAGNVKINNLKSGIYTFTLKLIQNDVVILSGSKSANVVSANTPVKFKLTPYGLEENGSIELKFKINTDDVTSLGTGIKFNVEVLNKKEMSSLANVEITKQDDSFVYSNSDVEAGCYVLKIKISNATDTSEGTMFGFWQEDALYVESGRETSKTIELPKLIYLPTWQEGSTITADSTNPSQIKFNWQKVLNAKYELQIKEISDTETIPTDATWDSLSDTTGQAISEINDNNYLFEVEEIEPGKKYVARVRAINMCGKSEWKYLTEKVGFAE